MAKRKLMKKKVQTKVFPVATEGMPFILPMLGIAIFFFYLEKPFIGSLALLLACFCLYFFRDPHRNIPRGENLILSPADGKIVDVRQEEDEKLGNRITISIFLSIFDVHINRFPVTGELMETKYSAGKFLAAFNPEASKVNEQNCLTIKSQDRTLRVKQIGGLIARRIVCWAEKGDILTAGQRFGLIRFGSRVDLSLPPSVQVKVEIGNRVKGGESILASFVE